METYYIGQCDRIRKSGPHGELIWQSIMENKTNISKEIFLANVDPWALLDKDETIDQFIQGDPEAYFAHARAFNTDFYLVAHSGFEFIWQVMKPEAELTEEEKENLWFDEQAKEDIWFEINETP